MASHVSAAPREVKVHEKAQRIDVGRIMTYVILTAGAVVAIIPFFLTVSWSLMNLSEATGQAILPRVPQWENYAEAWEEADFSIYFFNSVKIAGITLAGQLTFCTLAAYAFARMKFPGKEFIYSLLLATLMLPDAVTWVPNFITITWLGRITPIQWMDSWPAQTIPFMASAFGILILRQFFQQIPEELWDAAQIDGAGHFRYLTRVVLPLSKAPMMTIIIFGFTGAWNALAWPLLVTFSPDWRPISYGLLAFLDEAGAQTHLRMAGSVITLLPVLVLYFLVQKQFIEGIAHSGLKG
jgi:ABC-type glycerol-3-phosphate transport system permease component